MKLKAEHIAQYHADGATVVRGAFTPAQMKLLEAGIERNMAAPSPLAIVAKQAGRPRLFHRRLLQLAAHSRIQTVHL